VDYGIALVLLLGTVLAHGFIPSAWALLVLPLLTAVLVATTAGVGCWLAALHILYRDIRYVTPFLIQL
jgi:lipopolysaccharide transport system permease protein